MPSKAPERPAGRTATTAASPVRLRVLIPGLLRSYTGGEAEVELWLAASPAAASPPTPDPSPVSPGRSHSVPPPDVAPEANVAAALAELDRRFPGLRFRLVDEQGGIRPHVKLFLDARQVRDLGIGLPASGELMIVGALSGG
jgi:molybdopterin synthase sulfur carrier subunit